jgi:hypothetical protein
MKTSPEFADNDRYDQDDQHRDYRNGDNLVGRHPAARH